MEINKITQSQGHNNIKHTKKTETETEVNPQVGKDTVDVRLEMVEGAVERTVSLAHKEKYWDEAAKKLYEGVESVRTLSDPKFLNGAPADIKTENLRDINKSTQESYKRAKQQERLDQAALVMYQGLDDIKILAHRDANSETDSEKFLDISKITSQATERAHSQERWDQAVPVLYQAISDIEMVAEHHQVGEPKENAILEVVDKVAEDTYKKAVKEDYWDDSAKILYAGLEEISHLVNKKEKEQ